MVVYHLTNPRIATICDRMRELLATQAARRAGLADELNLSLAQI